MAKIYSKGGTEKVIINAVREAHLRQFQATDWTDLRVGFFLSITDDTADDTTSGLSETISNPNGVLNWVRIGVTDRATGTTFCGYSNVPAGSRPISTADSKLVTSDVGITTANAFYWRPSHSSPPPNGDIDAVHFIEQDRVIATAGDGSQPHFIQADPGAGEYCTFLGLRFTRPNSTTRAKIITMQVKRGTHSGDMLFTNTPTNAIAEAQLESFPTTVNTLGPIELAHVPDTFLFYWPFHNSRLRIHEVALVKSA